MYACFGADSGGVFAFAGILPQFLDAIPQGPVKRTQFPRGLLTHHTPPAALRAGVSRDGPLLSAARLWGGAAVGPASPSAPPTSPQMKAPRPNGFALTGKIPVRMAESTVQLFANSYVVMPSGYRRRLLQLRAKRQAEQAADHHADHVGPAWVGIPLRKTLDREAVSCHVKQLRGQRIRQLRKLVRRYFFNVRLADRLREEIAFHQRALRN